MATATLFHLMELNQLQSIPKWGLRVCNYCGCSSSNGAYACKSCNKLFQQIHETKVTKRAACDVSELLVPHDVPKPTRYEQGSVAQTKGPWCQLAKAARGSAIIILARQYRSRMRSVTCLEMQCSRECEHTQKTQE